MVPWLDRWLISYHGLGNGQNKESRKENLLDVVQFHKPKVIEKNC